MSVLVGDLECKFVLGGDLEDNLYKWGDLEGKFVLVEINSTSTNFA